MSPRLLSIKVRGWAKTAGLVLLGFATITLALRLLHPGLAGVAHLPSGKVAPTSLPWSLTETGRGRLDLTLNVGLGTPKRWTFLPDDHFEQLRVNGVTVPLTGVPPASLDDWMRGFVLDLGPWLRSGENRLEIVVENHGGPGGLGMRPVLGWRNLLMAVAFFPWVAALARVFSLRRSQSVILCGALAVVCWYWSATMWSERSYDVKQLGETGHIDYVVYVAEHGSPPPLDQGWEYYQPPVYYEGAALMWRWARRTGISGTDAIQAYSLILWIVFLTASAGALRLTIRSAPGRLALATAAIALWPNSVMESIRIGNDVGLFASAALATWFMVRWWRGGRRGDLAGVALSVAVAFGCKGSALAPFAAATALLGLRLMRHGRWRRPALWAEAATATAVMVAGAVLALSRNYTYWRLGKVKSLMVSNIGTLDDALRTTDDVWNFVPMDVATFLGNPWMDSRDDATGRRNLWNYFLRSSLSGEFRFDGEVHRFIATLWGIFLITLLACLLRSAGRPPPSLAALWKDAPWWLLGLAWIGSLFCARVMNPFPCIADFRLVVPVLVPFILVCTRGRLLPRALLCAIGAASAAFFVTL